MWTANVKKDNSFLIGYYSLFDSSKEISFVEFPNNYHLLEEVKDEIKVKKLIQISQGWYTAERRGDTLYYNDLRFGQLGFRPTDPFVFSYELKYTGDKLMAIERPKTPSEAGKMLSQLWGRVKGI